MPFSLAVLAVAFFTWMVFPVGFLQVGDGQVKVTLGRG
jgi:hypothetical protein